MTETVREFLIGLGWDDNESQRKHFEASIQSATLRAKLLGDGLEELGRKVFDSVSGIATNFDKLYFQAQRTNTAAATISDFVQIMGQAGVSAGAAESSVRNMTDKLRAGTISITDANRMGWGLNPLTHQWEIQRQYVENMGSLTQAQIDAGSKLIGQDVEVSRALQRLGVVYLEQEGKLKAYRDSLGLDYKKAEADGLRYMTAWRDTEFKVGEIGKKISDGLTVALVGPLKALDDFLTKNAPAIGKDIDIIMKAVSAMTSAWTKDLEKLINDPVALGAFNDSMHAIAVDIANMATNMSNFVQYIIWLNNGATWIADLLNKLTGQKAATSAFSGLDPNAPKPVWDAIKSGDPLSAIPKLADNRSWWQRTAPTWAGGQDPPGGGGPVASGSNAGSLTALIEEVSAKEGIDPRIMHGIRAGESGHGNNYDVVENSIESSYGPFQLNRKRGLGVDFERDTKLDLADPATIPAQAAWVAHYIKVHNGTNGQWMGYNRVGNSDPDRRWGESGYKPTPAAPEVSKGAANGGDYAGLKLSSDAIGGGASDPAIIALARHVNETEDVRQFSSFNDSAHGPGGYVANPSSFHLKGLAFDVNTNDGDYEASRQRTRAYLTSLGLTEGSMGNHGGDFAIEPKTSNHMHVEFKSSAAAQRYTDLTTKAKAATAAAQTPVWKGLDAGGPLGGNLLGGVTPTLGGAAPGGGTTIHAPMDTKIIIDGLSGATSPTPHMVAAGISQKPATLTGNSQGATS